MSASSRSLLLPRAATAQKQAVSPIIVTLVGTRNLPHSASAVVRLRPAGGGVANLILVDTTKVTPSDLSGAVRAVVSGRAKYGSTMKQEMLLIPRKHTPGPTATPASIAAEQGVMKRHLSNLAKGGAMRRIAGLGNVKAIDLVIPARPSVTATP